jgi:predicted phosphodiesterase
MRVALLADIHGNSLALDAVLADIEERGGVEGYRVLGDLVAIGPDPIGVLERLDGIPNTTFVRGNTDRYTVTADRPWPREQDVEARPELRERFEEVQRSFAWTADAVAPSGWRDWLAELPLEARRELPDATQVLLVHASPGTDDGEGLRPDQTDQERAELLAGCNADLVAVGHTHWAGRLDVGGIDVVAAGSVSNPMAPDLRASYAILDADNAGYSLEHRRVVYDLDAAIALTEAAGHPAASWIISHFRGERVPSWAR